MSFEKNMKRLDEIVKTLEDSQTTLEEGLTLYEQGILTAKECLNALDSSKGKISVLNKELGRFVESAFDLNNLE